MAKSQQTFNKLEREKNRAKKREQKRKKMLARKEARESGDLKQDESFGNIYIKFNQNG